MWVLQDRALQRPLVIGVAEDIAELVFFDKKIEAAFDAVRRQSPSRSEFRFLGFSADDRFGLVRVRSERQFEQVYVFDSLHGTAAQIWRSPLGDFDDEFVESRPVHVSTSDGNFLAGYITEPRLPRRPRSAIIMLHGGPPTKYSVVSSRLVQGMVDEGHTVLRLNFRGSIGYGKEFRHSIFGNFFESIITDVENARNWLIESGVAEPRHIYLMGSSFGGYAALTAHFGRPGKFRGAISTNGMSDLNSYWAQVRKFRRGRAIWGHILGLERLSHESSIREYLEARSPISLAGSSQGAVLLIAGLRDRRVSPKHAKVLADRLRELDAENSVVLFENEGHTIRLPENLVRQHRAILQFLDRTSK